MFIASFSPDLEKLGLSVCVCVCVCVVLGKLFRHFIKPQFSHL